MTTSAPASASASAVAAPMPRPAPVTTATWPSSRNRSRISCGLGSRSCRGSGGRARSACRCRCVGMQRLQWMQVAPVASPERHPVDQVGLAAAAHGRSRRTRSPPPSRGPSTPWCDPAEEHQRQVERCRNRRACGQQEGLLVRVLLEEAAADGAHPAPRPGSGICAANSRSGTSPRNKYIGFIRLEPADELDRVEGSRRSSSIGRPRGRPRPGARRAPRRSCRASRAPRPRRRPRPGPPAPRGSGKRARLSRLPP